jgi:hypothetical protein
MTTGPNTNTKSAERDREKLVNALRDEVLIKQLEAAIDSQEIYKKALDLIDKRLVSGEVSDHMLLRILVSLSKVGDCLYQSLIDNENK